MFHNIDGLNTEDWKSNGELFVCLAQTPAPKIQQILTSQAHPNTLTFLRDLLEDSDEEENRSHLEQMAPLGDHKALVLIPEFAISMDGWEAVDGYVRSMRRSAIVLGGIGLVKGPSLLDWRNGNPDNRFLAEDHTQATFANDNHVFNVAACWSHLLGQETKCTIFLKSFPEQRQEIRIPGLQRGSRLVRIKTQDLHIYPAICADLTSQQEDGDNPPLTRIVNDTVDLPGNKDALLAGMSYEPKPQHAFWQNGVAKAVGAAHHGAILLIANNALDPCATDEGKDQWRCLTGAYVSSQQQQTQDNQELMRSIGDRAFSGVLSRLGTPFAQAGLVSWNHGGGGIRDLYRATTCALVGAGGALNDPISSTKYSVELERFIRRYSPQYYCAADNCDLNNPDDCTHRFGGFFHKPLTTNCQSQSVKNKFEAMKEVRELVVAAGEPNTMRLLDNLCHGVCAGSKNGQVDPDTLHDNRPFLERGIQVLGAMALQDGTGWAPVEQLNGQLANNLYFASKLVWIDNVRSRRLIETLLDKWLREGGPTVPLLVVCEGADGAFTQANQLLTLPRGDITQSADRRGSILSPRLKRIWILPLGEIENHWGALDMKRQIEDLLRQPLTELARR